MLKRFDHIVKNALSNLNTSYTPDWEIFHDLLKLDEEFSGSSEFSESLDQELGETLHNLEYTAMAPDWSIFESSLDATFDDEDALFDQTIREKLDRLPEMTGAEAAWVNMSDRLDEMNASFDAEFDKSISDALDALPIASWQERHWQMLSSRLDRLNDRPRLLMMKIVEAAAIILLLIQISNLYTDVRKNKDQEQNMATYLEHILNEGTSAGQQNDQPEAGPHAPILRPEDSVDLTAKGQSQASDRPDGIQATQDLHVNRAREEGSAFSRQSLDPEDRVRSSNLNRTQGTKQSIASLVSDAPIAIPYSYLMELKDRFQYLHHSPYEDLKVTPQLHNDPQLITYQYNPGRSRDSSPRLGIRDINLLADSSVDSVLNSIPTLQVIRPKIHSSLEVGLLADATNVEIKQYLSLNGPYNESTLNPGAYFRYKIQYQDIFGSLGTDYVQMKYNSGANELVMVTLPMELGYNFVNLSSFRMFVSGGIAGRFVPSANYSLDKAYNQESSYNTRSSRSSNGLLHNGPFEINYYLSGRLSMGLDININKKTSISLRYSHDHWLKGQGIGYNQDKFRSNHLSIGANFHL